MTVDGELSEARRLLPEGSQVAGVVSLVPRPGVVGVFVDLPGGMYGFVDVLHLPRLAADWPAPGLSLNFEVMQHTPGQVRLWPLDPRFHHDDATPELEAGWRLTRHRYPVGSVVPAVVACVFPFNQEYAVRLADDDDPRWSLACLPWTGRPPVAGDVGRFRITRHLDATRRIMLALIAWLEQASGGS